MTIYRSLKDSAVDIRQAKMNFNQANQYKSANNNERNNESILKSSFKYYNRIENNENFEKESKVYGACNGDIIE